MDMPQDLGSSLTDLLASRSLDLLLTASTADVIAADARFSLWMALHAKGSGRGSDALLEIIGEYEDATEACQAAIARFRATGDGEALHGVLQETLLVLGRHAGG